MTICSQNRFEDKISGAKALFLVTGTCIGGGMLAIPMQTAEMGFWLSLAVLFISWVFMVFTGLLLIEATLWMKARAHFSSLSQFFLGTGGRILSLVVYLFMNASSLVAYTSGGALLIKGWLQSLFGLPLGYGVCCVIFTVLFGGFVYLGVSFVSKVNRWLSCLMGVFFLYLIALAFSKVEPGRLVFYPAWIKAWHAFPLVLASFSYQMIVPSLSSYLNYEVKPLKKAIVFGTSLPFGIYLLWLLAIHGLVPLEGVGGLQETLKSGALITEPLKLHLTSPFLVGAVDSFAFFALATSYLGLSIALFDFIYDLFKEKGVFLSKNQITALSIIPCLALAIFFPGALVDFLDFSGGFGDALLSGVIPIAMVWVGRYRKGLLGEYRAPGGKGALLAAAFFALSLFIFQWVKLLS